MKTFKGLVTEFGVSGLISYIKLKTGRERLILNGIKNPIYVRKASSDVKLFKQILVYNEYEFALSSFNPSFIIDAGANIGLSSLFFARKYPSASIVALEPEDNNYSMLKKNTIAYPNIIPIHAGLWTKKCKLEIVSYDVDSTGFMVREATSQTVQAISACSINDLLIQHSVTKLDMIKLDIEGAEREILTENNSWLEKTKIVIVELHDRKQPGCSHAFFSAFQKYDFVCHPFGQNFLLINQSL